MHILLAGIESSREHSSALAQVRAPYILTSYYYAGWKKTKMHPQWYGALKTAKIRMIDSGAFTLRTSVLTILSQKGAAGAKDLDYDKYTHAYMRWLKTIDAHRLADIWIEMDIGAITGAAWVNRHRAEFMRQGLGHGLVQVWHSEHDWDYWLYLLREAKKPGRSNYVAIEGHQHTRDPLDYTKFLRAAYDRGVKVHGFKMTAVRDLTKYPFYSVDSTTWNAPAVHGSTPITTMLGGVKMVRHPKTFSMTDRLPWSAPVPRRTTRKERMPMLIASATAVIEASARINQLWKSRGVDWDKAIAHPRISTEETTHVA